MRRIFDTTWRKAALSGDSNAIRTLCHETLEPLFSFCLYRVGGDRHLCEEVVQETLLVAIRELDHYQPKRASNDVFPWLTGLARNEIRSQLDHRRRSISLETLWAKLDRELLEVFRKLDGVALTKELLQREETRELVNATMSQLPPRYRQSLQAKYIDGHSVRYVAGLLELSEKATESMLTRARGAFRATFLALSRTLETELS